ncbi:MAG: hypothetical protein LBP26_05655 [Clostridiales bacterium]|jgi:hypothetical protein|nr:hypothetical protein [Clostridiales bacterium]
MQNALLLIPEFEGKNDEVLFAHNSFAGDMYGYLRRLGSTKGATDEMIDIYETLLIDKNYNLKKIEFYWNGYFQSEIGGRIRLPSGFIIRSNSKFVDEKHNRYMTGFTFDE